MESEEKIMRRLTTFLITLLVVLMFSTVIYADIKVGSVPQDVEDVFKKEAEGVKVESWITNLNIPWQLIFLPETSRALVTERSGIVRLIENGNLVDDPYAEPDVETGGEGGLMGIAHHPDFPAEPYIYIMYTYKNQNGTLYNKVTRLTDRGTHGDDEEVILDEIPASRVHNGGRIAFGPDNKLYVTTGDTWNRTIAQSMDNLGGKILRLNPDGSIPEDNPYEDSYIYSLGHRNPQGLAWHPKTGHLFITDHGPSGEEGLQGRDRVKVIKPGGNYGWPDKIGYLKDSEHENPLIMWPQATPPSGLTFYEGELYIATLGSSALINVHLTHEDGYNYSVDKIERWFAEGNYSGVYGRFRAVMQGPAADLYLLTSNRDGRGNPREGDDHIYKLTIEN